MLSAPLACQQLSAYATPQQAKILSSFFKTGPGQYGENDVFIGVKVPQIRHVAKQTADISLEDIMPLLRSAIHEERFLALLLLIRKFEQASTSRQETVINTYLSHTDYVNNWDLVDLSAPKLLGKFLLNKKKDKLYSLAQSASLWERRIAIVSTFAFIRENQLLDTFSLSDLLMQDTEDLMHKATGWMLREAGKRDPAALETYLLPRYPKMPRTMLRYAIERMPEKRRRQYLAGSI